MPLYQIQDQEQLNQLINTPFHLEKELQGLIEKNLLSTFGVRFIASEFRTRGQQAGRIDTLGLSEGGDPAIIEYKRGENQNVINQGLYYINWLVEHREAFILAAQAKLGAEVEIAWSNPRLIIIAQSYTKFDTFAVQQMGDGIELWKYVLYGKEFLYLEQVYGQPRKKIAQPALRVVEVGAVEQNYAPANPDVAYSVEDHLVKGTDATRRVFLELQEMILNLSGLEDEIVETPSKLYVAYRHGRNFCEIEVQKKSLKIHLDIPFQELADPQGITKDVSNIGHWGTGMVEVKVDDKSDLAYILGLIEQAYQRTV